eukprot:TCONS_00044094-protein
MPRNIGSLKFRPAEILERCSHPKGNYSQVGYSIKTSAGDGGRPDKNIYLINNTFDNSYSAVSGIVTTFAVNEMTQKEDSNQNQASVTENSTHEESEQDM